MMSQAQQALEWVTTQLGAGKCRTLGVAINKATPKYLLVEKLEGRYRVYHFADKSYIMTYIDPKIPQLWAFAS